MELALINGTGGEDDCGLLLCMYIVQMQLLHGAAAVLLFGRRDRISNLGRVRFDLVKEHTFWLLEKTFYASYRMHETAFENLLDILRPGLERNQAMAERSSEAGRIEPAVRLAVTLRYLAGGTYVDLLHLYHCAKATTYAIIWATLATLLGCVIWSVSGCGSVTFSRCLQLPSITDTNNR